jgi:glycosyltransferase involved in cell wall biosynthesis
MKILMLGSGSIRSNFMYRLLALGKALAKRGHDVSIIAPSADKYNDFVPEKITEIGGVRILQPFQFVTKRLEINLLPYLLGAARMVLSEKPDLVYVYKPTPISVIGFIAKLRKIPVVLDVDDLGSEVMRIEGHPAHQRKLVAWCEKFSANKADTIVAASSLLRDKHQAEHPSKKIIWVPNGVEADWFDDVLPPKRDKQVVFFGSLNRTNILDPMFDVFPEVLKKHKTAHLLLIGDGKYMPYFKAKAKKLGITKHITFTGWLQLPEAKRLLVAGDIGYNYMPNQQTVWAASNMKVSQYMARGVVPLISDAGDLPWMVDGGAAGYIAEPDNTAAFAKVLLEALADPGRPEKSKRARTYAEKQFQWDKLAIDVEVMLKSLCERAK